MMTDSNPPRNNPQKMSFAQLMYLDKYQSYLQHHRHHNLWHMHPQLPYLQLNFSIHDRNVIRDNETSPNKSNSCILGH